MTTSSLDLLSSAFEAFPAALPALLILIKITCLLVIALAATLVMQRAPAGSRHLVWLVALGALLVLPALAAWGTVAAEGAASIVVTRYDLHSRAIRFGVCRDSQPG